MSTCRQLQDLVALYACGEVDDRERARVEQHLQGCPECRRAASQMSVVSEVAAAHSVEPPRDLPDRVLARVRSAPPARLAMRWTAALAYGTALLLMFGAGVVVGRHVIRVAPPTREVAASQPRSPRLAVSEPEPRQPRVAAATDETETAAAVDAPAEGRPTRDRVRIAHRPRADTAPEEPTAAELSVSPQAPVTAPRPVAAPQPMGPDDARLASVPPEALEWQ